ncbi:uncharacterized protein LOC127749629 [Frankliniella occidentalis]|uniref:Uncharacterized protein LOC127749629 n=1 Tax=Frankliniella occidentalis TaxID=133901 RepID=A0A9C6U7M1_FRAOC|nr:uncharacterized protein LOC127749629 [Frankliniella occidentalis]
MGSTSNFQNAAVKFFETVTDIPDEDQPFLVCKNFQNLTTEDSTDLAKQIISAKASLPSVVSDNAKLAIVYFVSSNKNNTAVPLPCVQVCSTTEEIAAEASAKFKLFIPTLLQYLDKLGKTTPPVFDPLALFAQNFQIVKSQLLKKMTPTLPAALQPHLAQFDEHDVASWLQKARTIYAKFGIKDADLPLYLESALPPSALVVHDANKDKPWAEYSAAIVAAFKSNVSFDSVRQRLLSLRRGDSETLRAYALRFKHAARSAVSVSEDDLCRIFLQAIPRDDARLVMAQRHSCLLDLVDTLEAAMLQRDMLGGLVDPVQGAPASAAVSAAAAPVSSAISLLEKFLEKKKAEQDQAAGQKRLEGLLAAVCLGTPAPTTETAAAAGQYPFPDEVKSQIEKLVVAAVDEKAKTFSGSQNSNGQNNFRGNFRGRGGRGGGYRPNNSYYPQAGWQQQHPNNFGHFPQQQHPNNFGYFPQQQPQPSHGWSNMPQPPPPYQQGGGAAPMGSVVQMNGMGQQDPRYERPTRPLICYFCSAPGHRQSECAFKANFLASQARQQ